MMLPRAAKRRSVLLLLSISIIAVCSIVYELAIGSLSTYLLGNSVYQFSMTIGLFMTAMGLGSYLSKFVTRQLMTWFIVVELVVGCMGGFSCPLLFATYSFRMYYTPVMWTLIVLIGTLIGLELPLLTRIFQQYTNLRIALAHALTFDYLGGLIGALAFPLALLPLLGMYDTSLVMGLANVTVVIVNLIMFRAEIYACKLVALVCVVITGALIAALVMSNPVSHYLEQRLYGEKIVFAKDSRHQRIVVTRWQDDMRLYLNGKLQFSALDEYRYHEALIHPAAALALSRRAVLILGGGDGLAAREVLKYADVEHITLVDIDAMMTTLGRDDAMFRALNGGALAHPKVQIVNRDAQHFLQTTPQHYNLIIIDLPDPDDEALIALYADTFYRLVGLRLAPGGVAVTQSTSPLFARKAFWCIHKTIKAAGFTVLPYQVYVPSFGIWGFNLFAKGALQAHHIRITVPTRFLSDDSIPSLFAFAKDLAEVETHINTLLTPRLIFYHREGWQQWGW